MSCCRNSSPTAAQAIRFRPRRLAWYKAVSALLISMETLSPGCHPPILRHLSKQAHNHPRRPTHGRGEMCNRPPRVTRPFVTGIPTRPEGFRREAVGFAAPSRKSEPDAPTHGTQEPTGLRRLVWVRLLGVFGRGSFCRRRACKAPRSLARTINLGTIADGPSA